MADRNRCNADASRSYRDCSLLETCARACCLKLTDCLASQGSQSSYPACARWPRAWWYRPKRTPRPVASARREARSV